MFDSNYRPRLWPDKQQALETLNQMYQVTDMALPTLDDEQLLDPDSDIDSVIKRLTEAGVKEIVLKLGTRGCVLVSDSGRETIGLDTVVQAVDTTAAGDSFNGGYLAARAQGASPQAAVKQGQRLSATVVQYSGAIVPHSSMPSFTMPEPV